MQSQNHIQGDNNVTIQGATGSTITIQVGGQMKEVANTLEAVLEVIQNMQAQLLNINGRLLPVASLNPATFEYLMGQPGQGQQLPAELTENPLGEGRAWVQSLRQDLVTEQGIATGSQPMDVFQHYGWLIQEFLRKLCSPAGQPHTLRRLSFMAEAYQASLRYLCYIQVAQLLSKPQIDTPQLVSDFLQMQGQQHLHFDYMGLLLTATDTLGGHGFVPEIKALVAELTNTQSTLYATALYLDNQRNGLLNNNAPIEDAALSPLLEAYLTALAYWLRKLAFLAKYRLVSIKEINLNYSVGTAKNFVHLYGELHGIYGEQLTVGDDYYTVKSIADYFTYNKSVLLFRGTDMNTCLENIHHPQTYLSLSPLVVDQSVYAGKPTQTPEIFYYTGYNAVPMRYHYAEYRNELALGEGEPSSNKTLQVLPQNNQAPLLNELFKQLKKLYQPFNPPLP
jgi:hypothetical protein